MFAYHVHQGDRCERVAFVGGQRQARAQFDLWRLSEGLESAPVEELGEVDLYEHVDLSPVLCSIRERVAERDAGVPQ